MRAINNIIVHCSASPFGTRDDFYRWHVRERGWRDIGYHWLIYNGRDSSMEYHMPDDGKMVSARNIDNDLYIEESEAGAHALGYNENSIGICYVGGENSPITYEQYKTLLITLAFYRKQKPDIAILGHNETAQASHKECPCLDMELLRSHVIWLSESMAGFEKMYKKQLEAIK